MNHEDIKPALRNEFEAGAVVSDVDALPIFERHVTRLRAESREAYAERLAELGVALVIPSTDLYNFPAYRRTLQRAEQQGIPVVMLSAADAPEAIDGADRAALKTAAIAAARKLIG